jgi:hypothetical protein
MDPTKLSQRTREALEKLPPEKRPSAEAIIARTQTPQARAKDAADRAILDQEYRETGRIATISEKVDPEDAAAFRKFIENLREVRLSQGLSLEKLSTRSKLDKAAVSRLEAGMQINPTVATLMRYAEALGMRVTFSLQPRPDATDEISKSALASPTEHQKV